MSIAAISDNAASSTIATSLYIDELHYFVRLGCSEAERSLPQEVQISLQIDFKNVPEAFASDRLEDTVCYAQMSRVLDEICGTQVFNTIERLSQVGWDSVSQLCPKESFLTLQIHKLHPPMTIKNAGARCILRGQI